mmetsp:Transcript_8004/g.18897  ORF Transcript_8004/g.18897 Transcript_8004/m.18897 type:complete len:315 (-) Transcript_8004:234-1178(-)
MQRRGNAYPHTNVKFSIINQQRPLYVLLDDPGVHPTGRRGVVPHHKVPGGLGSILRSIRLPFQLRCRFFLNPRQHVGQLLQRAHHMDAAAPGHHRRLQYPYRLPSPSSEGRRNAVPPVERTQVVPAVIHRSHPLHCDRLPRSYPSELHMQQLEGLETAGGSIPAHGDGQGEHVKSTLALVVLMYAQIPEQLVLEGDFRRPRKPTDKLLPGSQLVPGHVPALHPLHVEYLAILRLHQPPPRSRCHHGLDCLRIVACADHCSENASGGCGESLCRTKAASVSVLPRGKRDLCRPTPHSVLVVVFYHINLHRHPASF